MSSGSDPRQLELERNVLGSIMADAELAPQILPLLTERSFVHLPQLFETITQVSEAGRITDYLTVLSAGADRTVVADCLDVAAKLGSIHAFQHALVLLELRMARDLKQLGKKLVDEGDLTVDVFQRAEAAQAALLGITNVRGGSRIHRVDKIVRDVYQRMIESKELDGVTTGFPSIDSMTGGHHNGELIGIGGRPSQGKSAWAMALIRNAIDGDENIRAFVGSFEMSVDKIVRRMINLEAGLGTRSIRNPNPAQSLQIEGGLRRIEGYGGRLYINDNVDASIGNIISMITVAVRRHGVNLVMLDYLQLLTVSGMQGGNREREIATMCRALKQTAIQLDIPILLLFQLSREVEKRPDKKPRLSDGRESGSIEQDADVVYMVWRPAWYGITHLDDGTSTAGKCWILLVKQREGGLGESVLMFQPHTTSFVELPPGTIDAIESADDDEEAPF